VGLAVVSTNFPNYLKTYWIAGGGLIAASVLLAYLTAGKQKAEVLRWSGQFASLILTLGAGFLVPGATVYYFGGVDWAEIDASNILLPARLAQYAFIAAASLLPALLYYLFDRRLLGTLRDRFYLDIFRLDPHVATLADVRAKYGRQIDEIYGPVTQHGGGRLAPGTRIPIIVTTIVLALGWTLVLTPIGAAAGDLRSVDILGMLSPQRSALAFAFLGAYFYGLNMVVRQYVRRDLRPKSYGRITTRVFISIILAWALELIAPPGAALVLSFLAGIFPETGLLFIIETLRSTSPEGLMAKALPSVQEEHPLTNLEGIDLYDRARLLDEGIANVEALAHHDLIDLMLETRFPVPRLVDWIDQAVLYLHTAEAPAGDGLPLRARLRRYGIRTATNLETCLAAARKRDAATQLLRVAGGEAGDSAPAVSRLEVIADALSQDEWMDHVRYWHRESDTREYHVEARHEHERDTENRRDHGADQDDDSSH